MFFIATNRPLFDLVKQIPQTFEALRQIRGFGKKKITRYGPAIIRAQQFLRRWSWYLKTEIAKYFDRVDHNILLEVLRRKIEDRRLLDLLERIIRNTSTPDQGLPIGNRTSQFPANVYRDPLDHDLKDRLGLRDYVRYMDDMVCLGDSKLALHETQMQMEEFLRTRLALNLKPSAGGVCAACAKPSNHGSRAISAKNRCNNV